MLTSKFVMTCLLALVPAGGALAGASPISLGAAGTFAVLAGSAVTSTGSTVVSGNLGVWPNDAVSGFPPGIVLNGQIDAGNATAMQAQAALAGAWQAAANEAGAESLTGQNLGGMSLAPGL